MLEEIQGDANLVMLEKHSAFCTSFQTELDSWMTTYKQNTLAKELQQLKQRPADLLRNANAYWSDGRSSDSNRERAVEFVSQAKEAITELANMATSDNKELLDFVHTQRAEIELFEKNYKDFLFREEATKIRSQADTKLGSAKAYFSDGRCSDNNREQAIAFLEDARKISSELASSQYYSLPETVAWLPEFIGKVDAMQQQIKQFLEQEQVKKAIQEVNGNLRNAKIKLSASDNSGVEEEYAKAQESLERLKAMPTLKATGQGEEAEKLVAELAQFWVPFSLL